ncbi:hypothetical protein CVT24_011774 [Panaeolus cyanescens]|uniref:Uncharacterized protein n=1 Tax=Panaeolus cyanescens TaxID=181874 RepID=A0A409VHM7_9AGAR|nr:hypothetical protein CVT24_011774 [Panaeolus cyanescens]
MTNAMTPRSSTPASSDDNADTASLRRSTSRTSLTQSLFGGGGSKHVDVHQPSPIAESPAREWEATGSGIKGESGNGGATSGPSPLAKSSSAVPTEPEVSQPAPAQEMGRPVDNTAPPLVDSTAGNHGAFKDPLEDDELPTSGPIRDPFSSSPPAPPVPQIIDTPAPQITESPAPLFNVPAHVTAPPVEHSDSYFGKPMVESMKGISTDDLHNQSTPAPIPVPPQFARAVDENSIAPAPSVHEREGSSRVPSIAPVSVPVSRVPSAAPVPVSRAPSVAPVPQMSRAPSAQAPPAPVPVSRAVSQAPPSPAPVPVSIPVSREPSAQAQPYVPASIPVSRAVSQQPAPAPVISRDPSNQPPSNIPTVPVTREPSQAGSVKIMPVPVPVPFTQAEEPLPNPHPEQPQQPQFTITPASPPFSSPEPTFVHHESPPMPHPDPYANPFADPYAGHDIWGGAVVNPGFESGAPIPPVTSRGQAEAAVTKQEEATNVTRDREVHNDPWGELPVSTAIVAAGVVGMDRGGNLSRESRKSAHVNGNANGNVATAVIPPAAVSREPSGQREYVAGVGVGAGGGSVSREPSFRMPNPHDSGVAPAVPVGFAIPFMNPGPIPGQESLSLNLVLISNAIIRPEPGMTATVIDNKPHVDDHTTIFMPLPPFQEVTSGKYPLSKEVPTSERTPLLTKEPEDIKHRSSGAPMPIPVPIPSYAPTVNHVDVSPLAGTSSHPQTYNQEQGYSSTTMSNLAAETHARILTSQLQPRLHSLGWLEYHLPDGMFYYVHPTRKMVTDLNLRRDGVLDRVTAWMEEDGREGESVGVFVEGWVVERVDGVPKALGKKGKGRKVERDPRTMVLERYWVDHHARSVVKDEEVLMPPGRGNGYGNGHGSYSYGYGGVGKGKRHSMTGNGGVNRRSDDDQLDMEYKYWTFMEAHPAHTALPPRAKAEAMDVLTWAWTDRLLPSHRSIPPPFNQDECNELSTLLRSFGPDKTDENGIETRIISRILIRVALWRQTYFRPHKPLPLDAHFYASNGQVVSRQGGSAFDIVQTIVACMLLGIPYLFVETTNTTANARTTAGDEAQMMMNPRSNPMLIVGGVSCIFAAIILSTSVTFLSMPSLSYFTRVSILVSLSLATLSLATTGIAILWNKSEIDASASSATSHSGGVNQERKIITARTLILSAPLVFLSYSIIAFLVAILSHALPTLSIWFFSALQFVL